MRERGLSVGVGGGGRGAVCEKYDSMMRVVDVPGVSMEPCGGEGQGGRVSRGRQADVRRYCFPRGVGGGKGGAGETVVRR